MIPSGAMAPIYASLRRGFREQSVGTFTLSGSETVIDLGAYAGGIFRFEFNDVVSSSGGDLQMTWSPDGVTYYSSDYVVWRDMTGGGTDLFDLNASLYPFARVVPTSSPGYSGKMYINSARSFANGNWGHCVNSFLDTGSVSSWFLGLPNLATHDQTLGRYFKILVSAGTITGSVDVYKVAPLDIGFPVGASGAIASGSVSSGAQLTSPLSTTYSELYVVLKNLQVSATGIDSLIRFSDDAGSTFKSGTSDYGYHFIAKSGAKETNNSASAIVVSRDTVNAVDGTVATLGLYLARQGNDMHVLGSYDPASVAAPYIINGRTKGAFSAAIDYGGLELDAGSYVSCDYSVYGAKAA